MTERQSQPDIFGQYFWPNKMGRMFLLALEDVMGKNGVSAVLNLAKLKHLVNHYPPNNLDLGFSFEEMSGLNQALEDMYGPRGGRGLAIRAGRAGFKYALKDFGSLLGMADLAFRLLPLGMKLKVGLNAMADTFNKFTDQRVTLEEEADRFVYVIDRCPVCWGRHADEPTCHAATGLLQETVHWISGGKTFHIEETSCAAELSWDIFNDSACNGRVVAVDGARFTVETNGSQRQVLVEDDTRLAVRGIADPSVADLHVGDVVLFSGKVGEEEEVVHAQALAGRYACTFIIGKRPLD
jgi:predicted hydrocarbon binding protein